jgi:hypothetical protein
MIAHHLPPLKNEKKQAKNPFPCGLIVDDPDGHARDFCNVGRRLQRRGSNPS